MDLTKIINKKDEAAQYMIDEITHIIKTFDKRDPGSRGEREACQYMAEVLQKDCGCEQADVESFKENPGSFCCTFILCTDFEHYSHRCRSCNCACTVRFLSQTH